MSKSLAKPLNYDFFFFVVLTLAKHLEMHPEFTWSLAANCNCTISRQRHIHIKSLICVYSKYFISLILKLVKLSVWELVLLILRCQFFTPVVQNNTIFITSVEEFEVWAEFHTGDSGVVIVNNLWNTLSWLLVEVENSQGIVHVAANEKFHRLVTNFAICHGVYLHDIM